MHRLPGEGFNKEKAVFLVSFLALCFLIFWHYGILYQAQQTVRDWDVPLLFFHPRPEPLIVPSPVTAREQPPVYKDMDPLKMPPEIGADKERKSPFAWTDWRKGGTTVVPVAVDRPPPPPPVPTPATGPTTVPDPVPVAAPPSVPAPSALAARKLNFSYMGTLVMKGENYALVKLDDGTFRRIKQGETVPDLGCTIEQVDRQAIHVRTDDGQVRVLMNSLLGEEKDDASAKTPGTPALVISGAPKAKSSPGQPKPAPQKAPKTPKVGGQPGGPTPPPAHTDRPKSKQHGGKTPQDVPDVPWPGTQAM